MLIKSKTDEQKRHEKAVLNSFNCIAKTTSEHRDAAEIITRRTVEAVNRR